MGFFRDLLYGLTDLITGADASNNSVSSEDIAKDKIDPYDPAFIERRTCMNCKFLKKGGDIYYCTYDQYFLRTSDKNEIASAKCRGEYWCPRESIGKLGKWCHNASEWHENI